jgi:hypothetical protein
MSSNLGRHFGNLKLFRNLTFDLDRGRPRKGAVYQHAQVVSYPYENSGRVSFSRTSSLARTSSSRSL